MISSITVRAYFYSSFLDNLRKLVMENSNISVKPNTRNHKGFFVLEGSYELVDIKPSGWALICSNEATCHYVDPDNLASSQD